MADVKCPSCGKINPETLEICQYCGTLLKSLRTEPLEPLLPGEFPVKKATSDLEQTLPTWLRDARRADKESNTSPIPKARVQQPAPPKPAAPPPNKTPPPPPKKPAPGAPFDLLAGLSQAGDDEEETPDWLKNLQSSIPVPVEPEPEETPSADFLAELQQEAEQPKKPAQSDAWGFSSEPTTFNFDETEEPIQQIGGDTPDWLTAMQVQEQGGKQAEPQQAADTFDTGAVALPADDLPDWLSALGGATAAAAPQPESRSIESQPVPNQAAPDWLSDLGGAFTDSAEEPAPAQTPAASAADTPDWLSSLGGGFDASVQNEPVEDFPAASAEKSVDGSDLPDWMADLQGEGTKPAPEQAPVIADSPAVSSDVPDWMAGLQEAGSVLEQPASAESFPVDDTLPDWMQGSQQTASVPPAPVIPPAEPFPVDNDLPDWMAGLQEQTPAQAPSVPVEAAPTGADLPDWMSGLQDSAPVSMEPSAPVAEPTPAGELPDWLAGLQETSAAPVQSSAVEETSTPLADQSLIGDLPDWLAGLQETPATSAPIPTVEEPVIPLAEQPVMGDLPDWMAGLQDASAPAVQAPAAEESVTLQGDMPDWLSGLTDSQPAAAPIPEEQKRAPKPFPTGSLSEILAEGQPDFMAGLLPSGGAELVSDDEAQQPAPNANIPDWLTSMASGSAVISLEASAKAAGESQGKEPEAEPASFDAPVSEMETASIPSNDDEQNVDSFLAMDMPDWLSGFTPGEADKAATPTQPKEDNLRMAELPSWVQAMRPVESMLGTDAPLEDSEDVEKEGPLAGFRGVLPVLPELLQVRKPKAYTIKIQVDDTQRSQAALLGKLLNSENFSVPTATPKESLILRPLRWIIFGVLVLLVLIPVVLGTRVFPGPVVPASNSADPFTAFYNTVEALPAGARVLVVTDYQPGFVGELEPAARPMIEHLMRRNARVAFVSTLLTSTEMGERLIQKINDTNEAENKKRKAAGSTESLLPVYAVYKDYVLIGYLPGGAAGVQAFASNPQKTTGVDSVVGDLWQLAALKDAATSEAGIESISDFAAVIVLTDDPDNGRLWIEQTSEQMEGKALLMVASMQAGPMLQPYVASGQVTGLVTGLEGGMLYDEKAAQPGEGIARQYYWDGFGVATLAAELLIFFGVVWTLVSRFRGQKTNVEQDEA